LYPLVVGFWVRKFFNFTLLDLIELSHARMTTHRSSLDLLRLGGRELVRFDRLPQPVFGGIRGPVELILQRQLRPPILGCAEPSMKRPSAGSERSYGSWTDSMH
jgi:hypothetical protein